MMRILLALLLTTSLVPPASSAESDWISVEGSSTELSFTGELGLPGFGRLSLYFSCSEKSQAYVRAFITLKECPRFEFFNLSAKDANGTQVAWINANLDAWYSLQNEVCYTEANYTSINAEIDFGKYDTLVFEPTGGRFVMKDNAGLSSVGEVLQKYGGLCR